jgi:hypothetical protein
VRSTIHRLGGCCITRSLEREGCGACILRAWWDQRSNSERTRETARRDLRPPERELERAVQSELEYWKAQYDFQKHLMTTGLAAAGAFVAILVGYLRGTEPGPWAIAVFVSGETGFDLEAAGSAAKGAIAVVFVAFLLSAILAQFAAGSARARVRDIGYIRTITDVAGKYASQRAKRFALWYTGANFALGLMLVLIFVAGNLLAFNAVYGQ